jgi:hypothetical protein
MPEVDKTQRASAEAVTALPAHKGGSCQPHLLVACALHSRGRPCNPLLPSAAGTAQLSCALQPPPHTTTHDCQNTSRQIRELPGAELPPPPKCQCNTHQLQCQRLRTAAVQFSAGLHARRHGTLACHPASPLRCCREARRLRDRSGSTTLTDCRLGLGQSNPSPSRHAFCHELCSQMPTTKQMPSPRRGSAIKHMLLKRMLPCKEHAAQRGGSAGPRPAPSYGDCFEYTIMTAWQLQCVSGQTTSDTSRLGLAAPAEPPWPASECTWRGSSSKGLQALDSQ